jgi:hypothetical protein
MAKKEDISNATLATLLVVAIVVSVGGTYVVLQRTPGITGLYTGTSQTGTISFNEQGVLSIRLTDADSSFGNITANGTGVCTISTDQAAGSGGVNCFKTEGVNSMTLNNDGNVNASVTINATGFSLGTGGGQNFKATDSTGACPGAGTLTTAFTGLPQGAAAAVCTNMYFVDGDDDLTIDYQLLIGTDVLPGNQTENVTFWAAQV